MDLPWTRDLINSNGAWKGYRKGPTQSTQYVDLSQVVAPTIFPTFEDTDEETESVKSDDTFESEDSENECEIWKEWNGSNLLSKSDIIKISSLGRVKLNGKIMAKRKNWTTTANPDYQSIVYGVYYYYWPTLGRKRPTFLRLHRMMAEAFVENPNNYKFVRFKDDNTENYALENLYWVIRSRDTYGAKRRLL